VAPYKARSDRVLQKSCSDSRSPGHSSILEEGGGIGEGLKGPCQLGSIGLEIGLKVVVVGLTPSSTCM
jgi:hypothetical protein